MVFGNTVGMELGLLLLYNREGLRCDLWYLVLRQGLELGLLLLYYREGLRYSRLFIFSNVPGNIS